MESKPRPLSSKLVSTIPIHIHEEDNQSSYDEKPISHIMNSPKPKLNQIVPQLPQFGVKSNSTALLYSKFIVKGLKQDKLSVVRCAFKKKQEITEACTIYRNRDNKSIKTVTESKTIENNNYMHIELDINKQDDTTSFNKLKSMGRASSAKIFKKPVPRQTIDEFDQKLIKNNTQVNLHHGSHKRRPTTAKVTRKNEFRFSQGPTNDQNKQQFTKRSMAHGIHGRQYPVKSMQGGIAPRDMYESSQINELISARLKDKLITVQSSKGTNYIERNIQNITGYSRKSSIYLTNSNAENLLSCKRTPQKYKKNQPQKIKVAKQNNNSSISQQPLQLKPQSVFNKADIEKHEKNMKKIQQYLVQSIPSKFHIVSQQIRKQQKRNHTDQNYQQLLSIDLDVGLTDKKQQINQRSAKACFQDYIQHCQVLQYNISSKLENQQPHQNERYMLDLFQCQNILKTYEQLKNQKNHDYKLILINQIRQITKNLKYFRNKPKQQIDKFFTTPFEIITVPQNQVIIEQTQLSTDIYIILNGSVISETFVDIQTDKYIGLSEMKPLHAKISLYDGQLFGEASRLSQKSNNIKITALQQSLLMKVKRSDYVNVFFQGSEVQQKIQILKLAFQVELNNGLIQQQDLQMLSMSLEKHSFTSKSIVFRQGEVFDKMIFVKRGKLSAISQYVLQKNREKILDMKQADKYVRECPASALREEILPVRSMKNITKSKKILIQNSEKPILSNLRRQNLINNQILRQTSKLIYYYFMKQHLQFIKGDTINWEPILFTYGAHVTSNSFEDSLQAIFLLGLTNSMKPVTYSLISNSDDCEVYFLSRNAFQYLPNNLKKTMSAKAKQQSNVSVKGQSQKQLKKWNIYKQKLCKSIVNDRKQRSCKKL